MKKYIGYYKNILEKKVCNDLIEYTNKMQLKPSTYSSTTGKIKNSEERVKMDDVWFKEGEPFFKDIFNGFSDVIKNYQREHEDCRIQKHCGFRLNKYSEGGFMSRHIDNIVSVASEYKGLSGTGCPTIPISLFDLPAAFAVFDVVERKSVNCCLLFGNPKPIIQLCNSM